MSKKLYYATKYNVKFGEVKYLPRDSTLVYELSELFPEAFHSENSNGDEFEILKASIYEVIDDLLDVNVSSPISSMSKDEVIRMFEEWISESDEDNDFVFLVIIN